MNTDKELYDDFAIKKSAIAQGKQELSFVVTQDFFSELFEENEFSGAFDATVYIDRNNHVYTFQFQLTGEYHGSCNRCLLPLAKKASFHEEIILKETDFPEGEDTDEIIFIETKAETINIASLIYEFCKVHFPMRFVHKNEKDCDSAVMEKLNSNDDVSSENNSDRIDPRWAELSKLKS